MSNLRSVPSDHGSDEYVRAVTSPVGFFLISLPSHINAQLITDTLISNSMFLMTAATVVCVFKVCWVSVLTPVLTLCLAGLADILALGVKWCLRAALNKPEERLKASMIPSADPSGGESVTAAAAVFSSTLLDSDPVTLLFTCQVLFITRACRPALRLPAAINTQQRRTHTHCV